MRREATKEDHKFKEDRVNARDDNVIGTFIDNPRMRNRSRVLLLYRPCSITRPSEHVGVKRIITFGGVSTFLSN